MKLLDWGRKNRHCLLLLYWIPFLTAFYLLEQYIQPKYIVHCSLDDMIPFIEYFIIPYFSWFLLLPAAFLYTLLNSKEDFQNLCLIMFGGMTICLMAYILFPNGLNLRPDSINNNIFGNMVMALQSLDTPSNVCPSIHVSTSVSAAIVAARSKKMKTCPGLRAGIYIWAALISMATMFIKQHSAVDVILGAALSLSLSVPVYGADWRARLKGTCLEIIL